MRKSQKYIGAHVHADGGVYNAVDNAVAIGAGAFALFVKNQRQWEAKPLDVDSINEFRSRIKQHGFSPDHILPHAGYLINLGNPVPENRAKSLSSLINELDRCRQLGLKFLNIHPGSHLGGISEKACIGLIADSIEQVFDAVKDVTIVLENTAGQGSNIGYRFEHLADIIDRIGDKSRMGVCLDTCHAYSAGYDLKDPKKYEDVMKEFEDVIGLKYLKGIHLNDSKTPFASRKDRHENLGKGSLGIDFFRRFINDSRYDNIPIILETIDESLWKQEIEMLYGFIR